MLGPKISVIIPIYNVEDYLARCLDSCTAQTLYDIEILCVDDGSKDRSAQIARLYAEQDPRFRVIQKENGGVSSARNAGLAVATGQWIMFLDADDFLSEDACERVWRESMEGPTDIIVFGTHMFPTYPEHGKWYDWVLGIYAHRENQFTPRVLFDTPCAKPFVWNKAFSAELLQEAGTRFDETASLGEDLIFLMEIFPQAEHFAFIPDQLYHYRWLRPQSAMQAAKEDPLARMNRHITVLDTISNTWSDHGWLSQYPVPYTAWYIDFLVPDLLKEEYSDEERRELADRILTVTKKYQLDQHIPRLSARHRRFWKKLLTASGQ